MLISVTSMVIISQQYFLYSPAIFIPINATSIPTPTRQSPQISILISQYINSGNDWIRYSITNLCHVLSCQYNPASNGLWESCNCIKEYHAIRNKIFLTVSSEKNSWYGIPYQQNNPPAILPIQIAYYAGLRIGEACGLAWQDVNLEEQCLTIRRSIRYDGSRHKNIIGPTKRKKVRIVDFGDALTEILKAARQEQLKNHTNSSFQNYLQWQTRSYQS